MQYLIKMYVDAIRGSGKNKMPTKTLDEVPAKLREQVKLALELEKNAK